MNDDNFELEEFIVPEDKKDKYEKQVINDKRNITDNMDISKDDLDELGLTIEELEKIAKERGEKAAFEYIEYLKTIKDANINKKDEDIKKSNSSNNEKNTTDNSDINLLTSSFISPLTNDMIKLDTMSIYDRIGQIYYHTGISITPKDPVFSNGYVKCINSFSDFLDDLSSKDIREFKKKLGKEWKESLLQQCGNSWNRIITEEINKEKDKASNRLREDLKNEKIKSSQLEGRVEGLMQSLTDEKSRNEQLNNRVVNLENDAIDKSLKDMQRAKEDLKRERENLTKYRSQNIPDFVSNTDYNIYNYAASKEESSSHSKK